MSVLINELKAQRAASLDNAKLLRASADREGRDLNAEERGKLTTLMDEYDRLAVEIVERERLEAADQEMGSSGRKSLPATPSATPLRRSPDIRVMHHVGQLRAFTGDNAKRDAYESGQFILATVFGNPAAQEWCVHQGMDARDLATNVNAKGGYLVPDQFERAVINLRLDYGVFRREARVLPMSSDHVVIPRRTGGLTVYFPGEGGDATAQDMAWDQVGLTAKKAATLTYLSTEVAEDAVIDLADTLAEEAAYAFAEKEDRCGFLGDGTATYAGIVGTNVKIIDGTHEAGSVEIAAAHDLFTEIDIADAMATMGALPDYARANAKWYCSNVFKATVLDRLKVAAGGATPAQMAAGDGVNYTFLGFPVVISNCFPASATTDYTDLVMALFGDLRQAAMLGDRRGVTLKVDSSLRLVQDQLAVMATERFDINIHSLGDNTNCGPIVAMVGGT